MSGEAIGEEAEAVHAGIVDASRQCHDANHETSFYTNEQSALGGTAVLYRKSALHANGDTRRVPPGQIIRPA